MKLLIEQNIFLQKGSKERLQPGRLLAILYLELLVAGYSGSIKLRLPRSVHRSVILLNYS
jgi:hypothetical protein